MRIPVLVALVLAAAGHAGAASIGSGGAGTIVVQGEEMALQGIHCEAPGTGAGDRAAAYLADLLAAGGLTRCKAAGARVDGRAGTRCSHNGKDIGALLIGEGLCARCPARDPDGTYSEMQDAAPDWPHPLPASCSD